MKRHILCIVCLVVFLLFACTLFSLKIEKEMLLQVEVKKVQGTGPWNQNIVLSQSVLFEDARGSHLYLITEGTGWESGLRVEEVPRETYKIDTENGTVILPGDRDYCFITTASRQPVTGELVEIIEAKEVAPEEDSLLFVYPSGIPESYSAAAGITVAEHSETAICGIAQAAEEPFFEHREAGTYQTMSSMNWRIFSENTVASFWKQIPLLSVLVLLVLCVVLLWVFTFFVSSHAYSPTHVFIFSSVVSTGALISIVVILSFIDLPSAMLPESNILHIYHYLNEYNIMISGLVTLPKAYQAFLAIKNSAEHACILIAVIAATVTGLAIIVQWWLARKK